jgi:hypothetical protein
VRPHRRRLPGGSAGNEQLTAILASVLLVLLAIEGATLLDIRSLLTVHVFVGMLVVPVVVAKLGSAVWRMARYYRGREEYVRRGPPHVALRVVVAPLVVLSTAFLLGTGIALLALDRVSGPILALHQASFLVWLAATTAHVLGHALELPRVLRSRPRGLGVRALVAAVAVAAGLSLAVATVPAADRLQDHATAYIGVDAG